MQQEQVRTTGSQRLTVAACTWLLAAAALGAAIQVRDGLFEPRAFRWLAAAIVLAFAPFFARRVAGKAVASLNATRLLAVAILLFQFIQFLAYERPGSWHGPLVSWRHPFATTGWCILLPLAAIVCIAGAVDVKRLRRVWFPLAVLLFLALGAWIIRTVPQPHMDAWVAQQEGLKAFVHGQNPYNTHFRDIYGRPEIYAEGALKDGWVDLGFPYPPVALWLDLPGYLLGGDYRWSNLAAMALAAILMAHCSRSLLAPLTALIFLFTPRVFFVLESGWTEPATALLLAATVFAATRKSFWTAALLGLLIASKQYLIFVAPAALLLCPMPWQWGRILKMYLIAGATAAVASLPLILWDPAAFRHSVFAGAAGTPLRTDALSFLALFAVSTGRIDDIARGGLRWMLNLGYAAASLATVATVLPARRRGGPAWFAAAVAAIYLAFFATYKFAFCNYYYLLLAALCCAAAAEEGGKSVDRVIGSSVD